MTKKKQRRVNAVCQGLLEEGILPTDEAIKGRLRRKKTRKKRISRSDRCLARRR